MAMYGGRSKAGQHFSTQKFGRGVARLWQWTDLDAERYETITGDLMACKKSIEFMKGKLLA